MLIGPFRRGIAGDDHLPELRYTRLFQAAEQAVGIGQLTGVLSELRVYADTALAVVEVGNLRFGAQLDRLVVGDQETDFLIVTVVDGGGLRGRPGYLFYAGRTRARLSVSRSSASTCPRQQSRLICRSRRPA